MELVSSEDFKKSENLINRYSFFVYEEKIYKLTILAILRDFPFDIKEIILDIIENNLVEEFIATHEVLYDDLDSDEEYIDFLEWWSPMESL